jgi:NAD(P)-dependent dehydrogenase (short-subunit alcohol dehydrogenase family)
MVAAGGGAIVNFTSISAKVAQTGRWLYPVGKAALVQLTRNMAVDLAADKIRVNSVSPGWTWSKVMVELTGGDRAKTDHVAAPFHLPQRVGDPEEVAEVVVFLCTTTHRS